MTEKLRIVCHQLTDQQHILVRTLLDWESVGGRRILCTFLQVCNLYDCCHIFFQIFCSYDALVASFWFWNIDGAVGRRVILIWNLIMYIGQAFKDIIRCQDFFFGDIFSQQ